MHVLEIIFILTITIMTVRVMPSEQPVEPRVAGYSGRPALGYTVCGELIGSGVGRLRKAPSSGQGNLPASAGAVAPSGHRPIAVFREFVAGSVPVAQQAAIQQMPRLDV